MLLSLFVIRMKMGGIKLICLQVQGQTEEQVIAYSPFQLILKCPPYRFN